MTNIEAIKEDYKIGDPIRITCRLGVKVGYIMEISESRIKLRPLKEGLKPITISDDSISDFEDYNPKHNNNKENLKTTISRRNPFESALRKQPISTISDFSKDAIEKYKKSEDSMKTVKAVGFIKVMNNKTGWIWDQDLKEDIFFTVFDICDDCLINQRYLIGLHVVYTKTLAKAKIDSASKQLYPKAVGICLPHPIYELLAIADKLINNAQTQKAYDILEDILEQYPDNEDAKKLSRTLVVHMKTRIKHSFGEVLNIDYVKEMASSFHKNDVTNSTNKVEEKKQIVNKSKAPRKPLIVTDKATLEALPLKKNNYPNQSVVILRKNWMD